MKKRLLLLLVITFLVIEVFASFVPEKEAKKIAKSHYFEYGNNIENKNIIWESINLDCIVNPEKDKTQLFYIFNVSNDKGWIIVSSHRAIIPVLAYSFNGNFDYVHLHPGLELILDSYHKGIKYAYETNMHVSEEVGSEWEYLKNFVPGQSLKQIKSGTPLLEDVLWRQSWPYNALCPENDDLEGEQYNGHSAVGCVALSTAMVMKHYGWPETGEGSYTHTSSANGGHGDITINFSQETYNWNNIPNSIGFYDPVNQDLAKLLFHVGAAVRSYWGPVGTGSSIEHSAYALPNFFKYESNIQLLARNNYTFETWRNILHNEIDNGRPMIYSGGQEEGFGHAFNLDGYQGDIYFHFNWGWGGNNNGYYTLDGIPYNVDQLAIVNIYPGAGYSNIDAELYAINSPQSLYTSIQQINPQVVIRNSGTTNITSANVSYTLNGGTPVTTTWSGNLSAGQTATITFDPITLTYGNHVFVATVTVAGDSNAANNSLTRNFSVSDCSLVTTFPYTQVFNSANLPDCWSINQTHTSNTWTSTTGYTIGGEISVNPNAGSHFFYVPWVNQNQNELLISETFNFTNITNPQISFWFNGNYHWSVIEDNCDLNFEVSISGGSWNVLWNESNHTEFSETIYQWLKTELDLSTYQGQSDVRFAFRYTGNDGANFAIDNIIIEGTTSLDNTKEKMFVEIFPNPSSNIVNLVSNDNINKVFITNIIGQSVYQKEFNNTNIQLNVSNFESGIYLIRVYTDNDIYTKKLQIK